MFQKNDRIFALTFSYAHVYLDTAATEADFGLRSAINFVSDEKLRSVERSNIGEAIREFIQSANLRDFRSFGFDDTLDLIRKVSGYGLDDSFAEAVTGARALRFTKDVELDDVPDVTAEAVNLFMSTAYQRTSFGIIDFLSPVPDPLENTSLDQALVDAIRNASDEFEIALPEIDTDGVRSFRFERAGLSGFHPDLSLELYREGLGNRLVGLSVDDLKKHKVAAFDEDGAKPVKLWSVYHSLVGSLSLDGKRYALNEGLWYRVDDKFKQSADTAFAELCREPDKKFRPLKKMYPQSSGKGKKRPHYQPEGSYNEEISKESGYILLDRRPVSIDDVPGPGMEACDLLDIEGRRLIHLKKSSRQSSVLSHLFKQGGNAAQMIKKYDLFRKNLVEVVQKHYGKAKALELADALDSKGAAREWTVEFQIADFPRENGEHNIPFLSKLTLRDEARSIRAMGFDVKVGFITLQRIH